MSLLDYSRPVFSGRERKKPRGEEWKETVQFLLRALYVRATPYRGLPAGSVLVCVEGM